MKDCPSCGASVPDSAAQCPSCRHRFEEPPDAGRTMLGMPAENVPDEPPASEAEDESEPTEESGQEVSQSEQERSTRSTQFGLPSSGESDAEEAGPSIDTSAAGPDEGAQDWSDLNEAVEDEPEEGSILSAWGAPEEDSGGEAPSERQSASRPEASERSPGEESSQQDSDESGRENRKTHMGMPRFDPDRISETEQEESKEVGDEDTAPGRPNESIETDLPEQPDDKTRQIDIDSLKDQVDDLEEAPEASAGPSGSEKPSRERADTSPGSEVVRSAGSGGGTDDEEVDPGSTLHGKAGKALGSGFREPEQPDHSSDVLDDTGTDSDAGEAAGEGPGEERKRRGTVRGMVGGEPPHESDEDAGSEPGEGSEASGTGDRSPRSTQLGQPVADPSQRPGSRSDESEADSGGPERRESREESERDEESSAGSVSLPSPGDVSGADASSSAGAGTAASQGSTGETTGRQEGSGSFERGPTDFEVDEDSGIGALDEEVEDPELEERLDAETSPETTGEAGEERQFERAEPPDETMPDVEETGEGEAALDLSDESAPEDLFAQIEEDDASDLGGEELEEVDFGEEADEFGEEFDFGDEAPAPAPEAPDSSGVTAVSREERASEQEGAEPTRQVERPEQFADEGELREPEEGPGPEPSGPQDPPGSQSEGPPPAEEAESPQLQAGSDVGGGSFEAAPAPIEPETGGRSAVQTATGVIAGLTLGAFLGVQTTASSGILGNYMVLALTLASGLTAAASFVTPFLTSSTRTRSIVFLGLGVVVAALAASVILLAGGISLGPALALCGGFLAIAAGMIPAFQ